MWIISLFKDFEKCKNVFSVFLFLNDAIVPHSINNFEAVYRLLYVFMELLKDYLWMDFFFCMKVLPCGAIRY